MAIPVVNPQNGDDLTAQSITVNVTDKIVAWAGSHEQGLLTNGAIRHLSDQIDDAALPETTVLAQGAITGIGAGGQHARNDMFASSLSALAGGAGVGFAVRVAAASALTYGTITKINTELATNATANSTGSQLVRRRADGSADFAATSAFVNITTSGTIVAIGNITGNNVDANGVIFAGSGNRQITIADGHLDATQLSGVVPGTSTPAFSGDVTNTGAALTVASVGAKTAAQIATSVGLTAAASATAVANHGALAKYDASGGMTFDSTVTAPTFVGALSGAATAVPASGVSGTIAASQIDAAIARTANVPTNAGVGATGTWPISVTGVASSGVGAGAITTAMLGANVVQAANIADYSLPLTKLADLAVTPAGGLVVNVAPGTKWNGDGQAITYPGGTVDLSSYVPTSLSNNIYVLIYVNNVALARALPNPNGSVPRALVDTDKPKAQQNTTPLAFVALSTGQSVITAANITPSVGVGGFPSSAVSGGSTPGHRHDLSPEVRQPIAAIDEFYAGPTASASNQILISPYNYRGSDGIVWRQSLSQTFGSFTAPGSGYRCYGVYFDPVARVVAQTAPMDNATYPFTTKPAFSGNQRSICYVFLTSRAPTVINTVGAGGDGTNGWIEDARVINAGASPASTPVGVIDGGTGQPGFSQGLIWQSSAGTATTPLTTIPATSSATVGLSIQPSPTGMAAASTVYDVELGGGTIVNSTTALTRIVGTHMVAPIKGSGIATDSVSLLAELPANGTNNASAIFAGAVRVGSTVMPGVSFDVTGVIRGSGMIQADNASPAAGFMYASNNAPQYILGNNSAFASRTLGARFSLATSNGQFNGSALAGDAFVFSEGSRLFLSAQYTSNVPSMTQVMLNANGTTVIGQEAWTAVTYVNSWVTTAGYGPVQYMKDSEGFISLRGMANGGATGTTMFTLPVGYRPFYTLEWFVFSFNSGIAPVLGTRVTVNQNGTVVIALASTAVYVNLEGIRFDTRA